MVKNLRVRIAAMEISPYKFPVLLGYALIAIMLSPSFSYAENSMIGTVVSSDGNSIIKPKDQARKSLDEDDEVNLSDLIKTSDNSTLVISFIDGAKVTLRPNTILYVKQYDRAQAKMSLVAGGIRVILGDYAKRNPALFKVITPDGEVTAQKRDSDFMVRICTQDCNEENKKFGAPVTSGRSAIIAKIVALEGRVEVVGKDGRRLTIGSSIYSSEKLVSDVNSYAQLQFQDDSKIIIQAKSAFTINDFKYNKTGYEDRSIFSLVEGGLRFVTGLIGKKDRTAFRLNTSVATIGIRGTDFAVNCVGNCRSGGIVTYVHEGSISHQNESGTFITGEGEYGAVKTRQSPTNVSTVAPVNFSNNIAPSPSEVQIGDIESLFTTNAEYIEPGTYVGVQEGQVSVIGSTDESPVVVSANLSVSVEPAGSVSSLGDLGSFLTMDSIFTSSASAANSAINTIRIGSNLNADSVAGAAAVATVVIQEQTIASPY